MNYIDSFMALQEIRAALEDEQRRINEEIRGYPPPIPRCDAQFNGLLEERAALAQALYDLDAIARDGDLTRDRLAEFARAARAIEGTAGGRISTILEAAAIVA